MAVERLLGAATLCALIAAIAAFNQESRRFLEGLVHGDTSTLGRWAQQVVTSSAAPLVSYASDNVGLVGLGVVAVVLFGLMMRTS